MPVNKLDLAKRIDHYKKTFHFVTEITRCSLSVAVDIFGKYRVRVVQQQQLYSRIPTSKYGMTDMTKTNL